MSFYIIETQYDPGEVGNDMTEKIVITQKQKEGIDRIVNEFGKSHVLKWHAKNDGGWISAVAETVNGMDIVDIARILYEPNSYEVEQEYKVGDWVTDDFYKAIGEVTRIEDSDIHAYYSNVPDCETHIQVVHLRHATPKEIKAEKERRLWKSIGRNVSEFKIDDVVMHDSGRAMKIKSGIDVRGAELTYKDNELEGLYPAESFISFEEVEE